MEMKMRNSRIATKIAALFIIGLLLSGSVSAQLLFREVIEVKESLVQQVAVKTNLAVDGAMVPNIGVQVVFPEQWSVEGNYYMAWWHNDKKHRYWQTYAGSVEVKKWLGRKALEAPLQGHHVGAYFMAGTYDFEHGYKGLRSDFTFNVGLSYGYGVKVANNLFLDFGIGVGYINGRIKKYRPQGDGYCIYNRKRLSFFGPTKAEISLVWAIGDLFLKPCKGKAYEIVY